MKKLTDRNRRLSLAGHRRKLCSGQDRRRIRVPLFSHLFDVTYEKILPKFYAENPGIEIKMRATYESYEDGTNTILREAVAGTLPDVTMQGLNRQAILVEKGIAKSLEPFIAKEADFAKDGYHKAMLDLGTFGDDVYGLPFSISLPVGYYNMEDHGQGWLQLPTTCPPPGKK